MHGFTDYAKNPDTQKAMRAIEEAAASPKLTEEERTILHILIERNQSGMGAKRLAVAMQISEALAEKLIVSLAGRGLVKVNTVRSTPAGREALND